MERQACDALGVQQYRMSAEADLVRRLGEHRGETFWKSGWTKWPSGICSVRRPGWTGSAEQW